MRLLLDTNIILWILNDDRRLSAEARALLKAPARDVFYSVASLWEVGIKHSYGRLELSPADVARGLTESGAKRLQITDDHLAALIRLPLHHRDPFDRMLIAQAEAEPLRLLTSDRQLEAYGSMVMLV